MPNPKRPKRTTPRAGGDWPARAREALRVPARLYLRVAERAGRVVLAAWLAVWPWLVALMRLALRVLRWAEREVTPQRAIVATAAAVAVLLAVSQFADYTATRIGADAYQGVEDIAPAPQMHSASAGSAHAWLGLPIAAAALLAIAASARGRRGGAVALAALGLATVAISLLIDLPKGLDEGEAAIAYEDVKATLEAGFWAQLVCGGLLVALAPLLAARAGGASAEPQTGRVSARRASAGRALSARFGRSTRKRGERDTSEPARRPARRHRPSPGRKRTSEGEGTAPGEPVPEG